MSNIGLMGENEELNKQLKAIHEDVIIIKERQAGLINDMSNMKSTIYGNGKQGLTTQIALIGQKVGIISAVVGGGVSLVATGIMAVLKGK